MAILDRLKALAHIIDYQMGQPGVAKVMLDLINDLEE
jgi:hypothetical protein